MHAPSWVFWLYLVTWLPYIGCLLVYGLRSAWRSSPEGRALMLLYAALADVLGLAWVVRLVRLPYPVLLAIVAVALGLVFIAGAVHLVAILRAQRHDRER